MQNPADLASVRLWSVRWFPRLASLCLLLTAVVLVTGCPTKGPKNAVSGKVLMDGKPIMGSIDFVYADGKKVGSPLTPEGAYNIPDPPPGQVKVVVMSMGTGAMPGKEVKGAGGTLGGPQGGANAPQKYGNPATTPLTYEVKPGKHTYDPPITP